MGTKERRGREEQSRLAAILSAAKSVFAHKGYYETRMDDIARKAELAKGTLYYYFQSKNEIFFHLMEQQAAKVYQEIKSRVPRGASFLEILEVVTNFAVEYFEANKAFLRIFLPSLCDLIHLGNTRKLQRSRRSFERHADFIRRILSRAAPQEGLPFALDDLMKFLMTIELGIGLRILEGKRNEARANARFFLTVIKKAMEKQP
jgi:AcrR family transcriptional regulator